MLNEAKISALKSEIETTIKKWSIVAETEGLSVMSSISILDHEEKGIHFMQSIFGTRSLIAQNICATLERVPKDIKRDYTLAILEAFTDIDEETEHMFKR